LDYASRAQSIPVTNAPPELNSFWKGIKPEWWYQHDKDGGSFDGATPALWDYVRKYAKNHDPSEIRYMIADLKEHPDGSGRGEVYGCVVQAWGYKRTKPILQYSLQHGNDDEQWAASLVGMAFIENMSLRYSESTTHFAVRDAVKELVPFWNGFKPEWIWEDNTRPWINYCEAYAKSHSAEGTIKAMIADLREHPSETRWTVYAVVIDRLDPSKTVPVLREYMDRSNARERETSKRFLEEIGEYDGSGAIRLSEEFFGPLSSKTTAGN